MRTISSKPLLLFSALLVLLSAHFFNNHLWLLAGLLVALSLLLLQWQAYPSVAYLLAFSIPISVAIPVWGESNLQFPSEGIVASLAIGMVVKGVFSGKIWEFIRNYPLPAIWVLLQAFAVIFSTHAQVSVKFVLVQSAYVVVFFYGAIVLLAKDDATTLVTRFLLSYFTGIALVLGFALYAYAGYGFNPVTRPGIFKPFYNDHTLIGAALALLAGVFLGLSRTKKWWLFFSGLAILGILLGASRAAILGVITLPFAFIFYRFVWLRWATLVVAVLLPIFFIVLPTSQMQWRWDSGKNRSTYASQNLAAHTASIAQYKSDYSNLERINRWVAALEMTKERPLFGFGPGTYRLTYIPYQQPEFQTPLRVRNPDSPPPGSGGSAHSEILLQLSESGIFPVVVFLLMLGTWGYQAIANPHSILALAAFLGLSSYVIHMQVNNFLDIDKFALLFWFCGAIIQVAYAQHKEAVRKKNFASYEE